MPPSLHALLFGEIQAERLVATATILSGPGADAQMLVWPDRQTGTLGDSALEGECLRIAAAALQSQQPERFSFRQGDTEWDIFVDVYPPPPRLIIVGAVHIAIPLVTFANALGFRTIVVDARRAFATPERFAHASELRIGWPADILAERNLKESACLVTLTHDEKLDNPALLLAIHSPVRYIGALGSRRTHAARVEALKKNGASDAQIARIHAPIGLNLGGRRPEEIAVAIMAEIVQVINTKGMVE
jgi:xanthine dehydrogenase accessory factor